MFDFLKPGDEIRVIAPSRSMLFLKQDRERTALKKWNELGYKVTYGRNVKSNVDIMKSSDVMGRVEDLHEAFKDPNVKAILACYGGHTANEMLNFINWELIKKNPKIFCGFSDFTALNNALYAKTGILTYSGIFFGQLAYQDIDYMLNYFKKVLCSHQAVELISSGTDGGYKIFQEGEASGYIVGGNLSTLQLLYGTDYCPSFKDKIIFIESDAASNGCDDLEFRRNFQALLYQKDFKDVRGIVIGRFEPPESGIGGELTDEKIKFILSLHKKELQNIPIIYNVDFGHTQPMFTFPIGGMVTISGKNNIANIKLHNR